MSSLTALYELDDKTFQVDSGEPYKTVPLTVAGARFAVAFYDRGGKLRVDVDDPTDPGAYVGRVEVDLWPQRGLAKVEWAGVDHTWQGKGVGQALYPIIDRELQRKWRLRLSSDDDGMRSQAAEALWKKLAAKGLAEKGPERYTFK